jgi:hypothetical protein
MMRKPFKSTRLATVMQVASLLVVASAAFAILISTFNRHHADLAKVEDPSKVQQHDSDASPRNTSGGRSIGKLSGPVVRSAR